MTILHTETEMLDFGRNLGQSLTTPAVIELVGDVGVGKTTITRGLAEGLDIKEPVTSPSFTIAKHYAGPKALLAHYDFYRLSDPGIMSEDLAESLSDPNTVTVIEWGESVADLLPERCYRIKIFLNKDGSRTINLEEPKK